MICFLHYSHGGSCIPGLQDVYGNGQLYCDCTNAIETINATLVTYVGKYCKIPSIADADTPETVACNTDKSIFCVNGGSQRNTRHRFGFILMARSTAPIYSEHVLHGDLTRSGKILTCKVLAWLSRVWIPRLVTSRARCYMAG
jgi:hypothetical protein